MDKENKKQKKDFELAERILDSLAIEEGVFDEDFLRKMLSEEFGLSEDMIQELIGRYSKKGKDDS